MDKIILVTGGSSDVGMELIREIYNDYSLIYLQYRNMNDELSELVSTIDIDNKIRLLQADFLDTDSIKNMIGVIKASDKTPNQIVHFPAPKAYNKQFHKDKWENYELGWEISVHSIVLIIQEFIKDMMKEKYGRIVFMLSSSTDKMPPKFRSSYVTVKYALLGLMKALASEYVDKGITVNGISPDMMETKFISELPQLIVDQYRSERPNNRNVNINEVIPVIKYMLSDLGASLTGQNIIISAGK